MEKKKRSGAGLGQLLVTTPFYLLVPLVFVFVATKLGVAPNWAAMLWGVSGWSLAYFLRGPIALLANRVSSEQSAVAEKVIVASSGLLEESTRVIVLILAGNGLSVAYSVGVGWAGIEVLYVVVVGYFVVDIMKRDDPKSLEIQSLLREMGMIHDLGALLGLNERLFASMFHVGVTLWLARWQGLILVAIVLHSCLNLIVSKLQKQNIMAAQIMLSAVGSMIFGSGLIISHLVRP
jgi:hypothetical protein